MLFASSGVGSLVAAATSSRNTLFYFGLFASVFLAASTTFVFLELFAKDILHLE